MKTIKKMTVKVLAALMLFSLMSVSALALGSVTLTLSKSSGYAGDSVTISGTADPGQWISIKAMDEDGNIVYFSAVSCDDQGDYTNTWTVSDITPGSLEIIAGYGSVVASESFTVNQQSSNPGGASGNDDNNQGNDTTIGDEEGNEASGQRTNTDDGLKITIPRNDFDELAGESNSNVVFDFGTVKVTFSGRTVDGISGNSDRGDISLLVEQVDPSTLSARARARIVDRPVFDFTLMAGDTQISNFAGRATISVPYTLKSGENPRAVVIYYISDSGELKTVRGRYNAETGTVDFTLRHFSVYALGYNEVVFNDVSENKWYYKRGYLLRGAGDNDRNRE